MENIQKGSDFCFAMIIGKEESWQDVTDRYLVTLQGFLDVHPEFTDTQREEVIHAFTLSYMVVEDMWNEGDVYHIPEEIGCCNGVGYLKWNAYDESSTVIMYLPESEDKIHIEFGDKARQDMHFIRAGQPDYLDFAMDTIDSLHELLDGML